VSRALCALVCGAGFGVAGETQTDKTRFSLFNPTPQALLRELSTDRPDLTESPYTVDAGHAQLEMDLVSFARDRHTEERDGGTQSWAFANTNFKLGLTNWCDLQLVVPVHQHDRGGARGFGDTTIRLKANCWGNDGGTTALAVMPFVKVPTASSGLGNNAVEGGLIIPFAAELPGDWKFGAMVEVDFLADDEGSGFQTAFVASVTFSHAIAGDLSGYLELANTAGRETAWSATFNSGLTLGLGENIQLDAGVNLGLTRAADDVTAFAGISYRF
jgi:hypothetical protein